MEGEAWVDCQIFITGQGLQNKSRDVLDIFLVVNKSHNQTKHKLITQK